MAFRNGLLSAYIFYDSSATKAGGFVRITGIGRACVQAFKQVKNGLRRTGRNEHTAGRAVSLDESLTMLNTQ
jgi:hypothetical protein